MKIIRLLPLLEAGGPETLARSVAKKLGLQYVGWGRWADKTGSVVARTVDGKLVKNDKPEENPANPNNPLDKNSPIHQPYPKGPEKGKWHSKQGPREKDKQFIPPGQQVFEPNPNYEKDTKSNQAFGDMGDKLGTTKRTNPIMNKRTGDLDPEEIASRAGRLKGPNYKKYLQAADKRFKEVGAKYQNGQAEMDGPEWEQDFNRLNNIMRKVYGTDVGAFANPEDIFDAYQVASEADNGNGGFTVEFGYNDHGGNPEWDEEGEATFDSMEEMWKYVDWKTNKKTGQREWDFNSNSWAGDQADNYDGPDEPDYR